MLKIEEEVGTVGELLVSVNFPRCSFLLLFRRMSEVSGRTALNTRSFSYFSACVFYSSPLPSPVLPRFYICRWLNVIFDHVAGVTFSVVLCPVSLCADHGR